MTAFRLLARGPQVRARLGEAWGEDIWAACRGEALWQAGGPPRETAAWEAGPVVLAVTRADEAAREALARLAGASWAACLVVLALEPGPAGEAGLLAAGAQEVVVGHDGGVLAGALVRAVARQRGDCARRDELARYQDIVESQLELICRFRPEGHIVFANQAFHRYFEAGQGIRPRSFWDTMPLDDRRLASQHLAMLEPEQPMTRLEAPAPEQGGRQCWLRWAIHADFATTGEVQGYQAVGRDISEAKAMEESVRRAEANLRQLIVSSADGMVVTDLEGMVLFANPAAEEMLGCRAFELVGQRFPHELVPGQRQELVLRQGEGEDGQGEGRRVAEVRVVETAWQRERACLATFRDITELVKLRDELRAMSLVDELTGIYNRRGFLTVARQQLKTAQRMDRPLCLFFMDLDDLKAINDRWGHAQGDRAIREAALVLKTTFRESDILGRWGGDEFVVLAMASDADESHAVAQARLEQNLGDWNTDASRPYRLSMSTGVAEYHPGRPVTLEDLISTADAAMYQAKRQRRDGATASRSGAVLELAEKDQSGRRRG